MQQALARQQPLARSRSHVRQIPLQRRYGIQVRDERVPEDIHAGSAAITGPEVLEELSPVLEDLLTGADVPRDVELPAPPAVEPLDEGERGVDQRAVDVAGDHVHDAPPSSGHPAEEEQSTSLAPTDRALLSYERLSRWRADGTWARVLSQAGTDADAARELAWLFAVDTPAVRAPDAPENGAAEAEVSAAA